MRDYQLSPPGNLGLPLLGETLQFLLDPDFAFRAYRRFGPVSKTHLLGRPTVLMIGPEAVQFVLSTGMEHFSWRSGWPESFKVLLGESLFLQDGEEHRKNRRLLMPAFHGPALAGYFQAMQQTTERYLMRWEKLGIFGWFDELKMLTFEIASELLIGAEPGSDVARLSRHFSDLTDGLLGITSLPIPGTRFGRAVAARDALNDHIRAVVRARRLEPASDALSLLVQARDEDGSGMNDEELTAQAMLMLFAGHETTTALLTWLCLELGRHPAVLARARTEQQALGSELSLDQLSRMPYLDQVLLEVERLHPPVGGGFRGVVKPFTLNGYNVPAGWQVLYSILVSHRLPEIYPDPDRFDPDRFAPEQGSPKPFSLIGFGGGPRVCIGIAFAKLEMKIVAALLLRRYQWQLAPGQSLKPVLVPTRRPEGGLKVHFAPL